MRPIVENAPLPLLHHRHRLPRHRLLLGCRPRRRRHPRRL
jgi:hypothetical protein